MIDLKIFGPLRHTQFPESEIMNSFAGISRSYLTKMLDNRSLPYNRMVRVQYNDGVISSKDICLAMMFSCLEFGSVAIIHSELSYEFDSYSNVISLTYNSILKKDFDLQLEKPIKSIIVKDYSSHMDLHEGYKTEETIKVRIKEINRQSSLSEGDFFDARNLHPCFFLVN